MPKSSSLDMLIELATGDRDEAARALGQLRVSHQQAQTQLETLIGYRDEYRRHLEEAMATGLTMGKLNNYQRFLASLELAIENQRRMISSSETRVAGGVTKWQSQQRRLNSYDVLATRRRQDAHQIAARQEQRQLDEYASRSVSALGGL